MATAARGVAIGGLVVLTACSTGGHPWWYVAGKSNCGLAAQARVNRQAVGVSNCAGLLLDPPVTVTVKRGAKIDVKAYAPLAVTNTSVLSRKAYSSDRSAATYEATATGTASITAAVRSCRSPRTGLERPGPCSILNVIVTG